VQSLQKEANFTHADEVGHTLGYLEPPPKLAMDRCAWSWLGPVA
jgi:hypothetical protein